MILGDWSLVVEFAASGPRNDVAGSKNASYCSSRENLSNQCGIPWKLARAGLKIM